MFPRTTRLESPAGTNPRGGPQGQEREHSECGAQNLHLQCTPGTDRVSVVAGKEPSCNRAFLWTEPRPLWQRLQRQRIKKESYRWGPVESGPRESPESERSL